MAQTADSWIAHASSHELPNEDIPILQKGETGELYGWPKGLLGPESSQRLHDMGIRTTSMLIRIAQELDSDQWRRTFGGKRDSCDHSVWPNRYAGVQEYLLQALDSRQNRAEFQIRINASNRAGEAGGRTTDAWAMFADTRQLPDETIPQEFQKGETGESYGWPSGMMGPQAIKRLHSQGFSRCSQLIQYALAYDIDDFRNRFGGSGNAFSNRYAGAYLYLVRCVTAQPENFAEYQRRLANGTPPPPPPSRDGLQSVRRLLQRYSIPENAGFAFIIFAFSVTVGALVDNSIKSPIASASVLAAGFYFVTNQRAVVSAYLASVAVFAHIVMALFAGSTVAHLLFLAIVYILLANIHSIPPSFIPSLLRNL